MRTAWVRDAQDAKTKRQGLLDQYQELKDQRQRIVKAGPEGDCPTCARPLGAEYEKVLELLDRQIEEVVSNGNFYKQRIEQLQLEPKELDEVDRRRVELERELAEAIGGAGPARRAGARGRRAPRGAGPPAASASRELEAALDRVRGSYDHGRHEALAAEIRALEPLALQAERLRVVADRARGRGGRARRRRGRERVEAARRVAAELRTRLAGLGYTRAGLSRGPRRGGRRPSAPAGRPSWRWCAPGASRRPPRKPSQAAVRRRAERAEREREAEAVGVELALHQELDRALTDLRTDLNAALRPDLSELASGFLRDLTNGRYTDLELDEDYGATLLDDGDPKAVISGGEEDVANLALRLAISQMIAERAGQPLSLLILDEIFGSLDEDRRAAVVDLLRSLADRFPQVILITHVDSVREGFDRVVRVGFDLARGVATVRDEPWEARCGGLTGASAGPTGPALRDIEPLNRVFADAFTDRYSRDGLVGVRVPHLNTLVWRYALEDAGDGAMVWRDADGQHGGVQHGAPVGRRGLDGPAGGAARPPGRGPRLDHGPARDRVAQGAGGHDHRARDHAAHGREHRLLQPDRPGARAAHRHPGARRTPPRRGRPRVAFDGGPPGPERLEECRRLTDRLLPGVDFSREIALTRDLGIGDTTLVRDGGELLALRPVALDAARGRPAEG